MSIVSAVLLQEVHDETMRDLRVEHEVANKVELVDEGRGILAKVVKNFHDFVRLEHLAESIVERVDALQIDNIALLGVVYLDQLHAVSFGETLAIHSENWRLSLSHGIHYAF